MRISALAAAAAALLSLAPHARGQDAAPPADTVAADTTPRTSLQKGTWSLSFALPSYGGGERAELGAWEMVGARTNLGLSLVLIVDGGESEGPSGTSNQASTSVEVGVNAKRYLMAPRDVTPFLLAGAGVGGRYERREQGDDFDESLRGTFVNARAGVGAEWFPARRFSVSGFTGFRMHSARTETEQDLPDDTERDAESSFMFFSSHTSALTVQIYF